MSSNCFLLTCLLFISFNLNAQVIKPYEIKGQVTDVQTNQPIPGVNILYSDFQGVITDNNGNFSFRTDSTNLGLTVSCMGYKTIQKVIEIKGNISNVNFELSPQIEELDEIIVSASKTSEKLSNLSVSVATIGMDQVSNNHTIGMDELIIKTPGVDIMDGQASIRGGSGYSYGAGSRVLLLIDGLPAISADAGNVMWHFLPTENVSKVEIIKGASSVLYGSSALNGVINLRTSEFKDKPETKLSVLTGIYDQPKQKNWKWWNQPRTYSNVSLLHINKIRNTSFAVSGYILQQNGYRKDDYTNLGRINLKLKRSSLKIKDFEYGINCIASYTIKEDFLLWTDADSGALIQNPQTILELNGLILTIDPYFYYQQSKKLRHELLSRFQTTHNFYPGSERNNSNANSFYTDYRTTYKPNKYFLINAGISETVVSIQSNFYQDHTSLNLGAYAQINIYPVNKLKIIAGMRVESYRYNDTTRIPIVPVFRAGINYQIWNNSYLRASFGQGYRYPSIAEKYALTTVGSIRIYPNQDIKPESGWNAEVGFKHGIRNSGWFGQFDIATFYMQNTNLIEYQYVLSHITPNEITGPGFQAFNVENSRIYGMESEVVLRKYFNDFLFNFQGGYTYIYPVIYNTYTSKSSDDYLKYRCKHSLKISSSLTYNRFELGCNGIYKSKILKIDNVFVLQETREAFLPGFYSYWTNNNDGYIVLDGYLSHEFKNKSSLSFLVKNLFNEEYMGRPGDIQPQRSYSLQYQLTF